MPAREAPERPEWLVPGADVLCYNSGSVTTRTTNVVATTITKVATQTFTVAAEREPRFHIRDCAAHEGGTWGWVRHVIPLDSVEAGEILASVDAKRRDARARSAVDDWIRERSHKTRLAAIAALQAIDND